MGLPALLGRGKQSCSLIETDGGDWNRAKPDEVQNNTFKGEHTNIRVAVINWATKVVWCSGTIGQFAMEGKCWITRCYCFFHLRKMQLSQASFWQVCNKWLHFRIKFWRNHGQIKWKLCQELIQSNSSVDTSVQNSLGQIVIGLQVSVGLAVNMPT